MSYREDIVDIELTGGSIHRSFAQHAIGGGDEAANRFGIRTFRNGEPENINGSVFGLFIRADGGTVAIESGTVEGNVAYVTLPSACYAVEGCFTLAIKVTGTNMTGTMRIVDGMVSRTSTDATVDPGTILPSIDDLIEAINEAVESIPPDYSDLVDQVDESFAGKYTNATEVQANTNFNSLTTPGNYAVLTSEVANSCSNIPVSEAGRLYVFSSTGSTAFIQVYITVTGRTYIRRVSTYNPATNTKWTQAGMSIVNISSISDVDNFPMNSVANIASSEISGLTHYPDVYGSGATIYTLSAIGGVDSPVGAVQLAVFYTGQFAERVNVNESWRDWNYYGVRTETFRCLAQETGESGTFVDLAWGIRYLMQRFNEWNEYHRAEIIIDPGTFSLASAVTYYNEQSIDVRGLFLPPFCSLKGAGKDRTIVTFNYTGTDETLMFYVSGLNVPYESEIQDLTITVKNLRYTIHSDNGMTSMPGVTVDNNKLLNDNNIVLKNVKLVHKGFDSGKHGTDPATGNQYSVPSCWGSGSFDNSNQYFYDCEFIANQNTAWLNHNRTGLTKQSEFVFERCVFINGNDIDFTLSNTFDSIIFISWGSDIKNPVKMIDCFVNRFVALSVRNNAGNVDAVCDYQLFVNNDIPVFEYNTNDSHLLDNYITGDCKPECAGSSVVGYKPVSKSDIFGLAHTYNSADAVVGIALNSASTGNKVVVQYTGLVYLDHLKSGGFAAGTNIGYNGSAWVEDNTHPIVKAVTQHVGQIIAG